jgi:hypothetical protein
MEFRRVEVKRSLRYAERVSKKPEVKTIFEALSKHCLWFTTRVAGYATMTCRVLSIGDDEVEIVSDRKVRMKAKFDEIELVEVESNCDLIAEEYDDGGRWARIITT